MNITVAVLLVITSNPAQGNPLWGFNKPPLVSITTSLYERNGSDTEWGERCALKHVICHAWTRATSPHSLLHEVTAEPELSPLYFNIATYCAVAMCLVNGIIIGYQHNKQKSTWPNHKHKLSLNVICPNTLIPLPSHTVCSSVWYHTLSLPPVRVHLAWVKKTEQLLVLVSTQSSCSVCLSSLRTGYPFMGCVYTGIPIWIFFWPIT